MKRLLQWGCLGTVGLLALVALFGLLARPDTPAPPMTAPAVAARPSLTPAATATPAPTLTPGLAATPAPALSGDVAQVARITDGDTIDVALGGETVTVRYVGIDTPERGQPGYRAATEANRALVEGKTVILVRDRSDTDRYGRLLRYVYLTDGTMVEFELAANGWAQPVEYRPDTAHAAELRQAAMDAALSGRGFWSGTSPYDGAMSYAYTTSEANLRAGPGTEHAVSGAIPMHTPLTVFGRNAAGDWLQVRTPERRGGWVHSSLLAVNVPVEGIPVSGVP